MAISEDAIEFCLVQGRRFVVLSNNRTDTGMGILNGPLMPLSGLLLGLFGTPAEFFLRSSDTYDPISGDVFSNAVESIKANVYTEEITIAPSEGTGQNQATTTIYVPGDAFGYESNALSILTCMETGLDQRKIQLP